MVSSPRAVLPLQRPPDVVIDIPGSKSHTNRALICAALAAGRSELGRVLFADDTEAMLGALTALGVDVSAEEGRGAAVISGGIGAGFTGSPVMVNARQSGTTSRFLLPLLAGTPGNFILDGHPQMRSRPFGPQLDALRTLGAAIEGDHLPLSVTGSELSGAAVSVPSSISSQFLSGLLLSAPLYRGRTIFEVDGTLVSRPYVDLTVATMAAFGVDVLVETGPGGDSRDGDDGPTLRLSVDHSRYQATDLQLEPDASAASYFFAAAAITGGRVRVEGLGRHTVQGDLGFVHLLAEMGAEVTVTDSYTEVRGTGVLTGITANMADVSDTAQTLAVVAAFADTPTEITGIGFIKYKETDRVHAVVTELNRLGIDASATEDGVIIRPGTPNPGTVDTYDDHRMAMSFSLLGLRHPGIEIDNPGCVSKTFPRFFDVLDQLR